MLDSPLVAHWKWTCLSAPIQGEGIGIDGGWLYYRQRRNRPAQLGFSQANLTQLEGEGIGIDGGWLYYRQRRNRSAQLGFSQANPTINHPWPSYCAVCVAIDGPSQPGEWQVEHVSSEYDDHDPAQRVIDMLALAQDALRWKMRVVKRDNMTFVTVLRG